MKKILSILLIVIVFSFLCGCDANKTYGWNFEHSSADIECVQIAEANNAYEYTVIKTLSADSIHDVFSDVENLVMKKYVGSLSSPRGLCIVFKFKNGDYDIISRIEPKHCKSENGKTTAYNSWLYCDETDFSELINKYNVIN